MVSVRMRLFTLLGLLGAGGAGLTGCGTFAFYEDTKVALALSVDPSAPDPVEVTAAFKESVYALAPIKRRTTAQGQNVIDTGDVLADFDVRYGVNANGSRALMTDVLYAVITHGLATGDAAVVRKSGADGAARRAVIIHFLDGLDDADLRTAATALNLGGLGAPDASLLRRRLAQSVNDASEAGVMATENALVTAFPNRFTPFKPRP